MIFPLFSSIFANTRGKPLSRTIKKKSRMDRLNGFSSRYECEQNAKIVCFFMTQNSFLLVPVTVMCVSTRSPEGMHGTAGPGSQAFT
jgi:hypothetical protein